MLRDNLPSAPATPSIYPSPRRRNIPNQGESRLTPPIQKSATAAPLSDTDIQRLETLLDALPAPMQPMDVCAVDGLLCGALLQPQRVPTERWLPLACDVDGRAAPPGPALDELQALLQRRHAELDRAIGQREWFDPWIFQLDDDASPSDCVLPWVAGFAAAMEAFPALMALGDPELVEPLALLFMHFDPEDLEDADALLEAIESLEPPAELADAVEGLVNSTLLLADVSRPQPVARRPAGHPRRPRPAGGGAGPRGGGGRGPARH